MRISDWSSDVCSSDLGRGRSPGPRLRQEQIAAAVRRQGRVSVEQLALRFKTSHETIRRDLAVLAETGAVLKVHGGAKRPRQQEEGPFRERLAMNARSEEHTSELQSLMRTSYAVFCLK